MYHSRAQAIIPVTAHAGLHAADSTYSASHCRASGRQHKCPEELDCDDRTDDVASVKKVEFELVILCRRCACWAPGVTNFIMSNHQA